MRTSVTARPPTVNCFILENGSTPVTSPACQGKYDVSPPNSPRACKLALEDDKHGVGGSRPGGSMLSPGL